MNQMTSQPNLGIPTPKIGPRALALIETTEISSDAYYNRVECHPSWPEGASGVTIGIGYDLGYHAAAELRADWGALLPASMIDNLAACCGVRGDAAGPLAASRRGLVVPLDAAKQVFLARSIPKAIRETLAVYPTAGQLPPEAFGALVSLVFNRGNGMSDPPDRPGARREMRQIGQALPSHPELLPDLIRSMARLWDNGLVPRRHSEADLCEQALRDAGMWPGVAPVLPVLPAARSDAPEGACIMQAPSEKAPPIDTGDLPGPVMGGGMA